MIPGSQNARFLEIAAKLKPELNRKIETPTAIVRIDKDESSVMGWKAVDAVSGEESPALGAGEQVVFDFSGHRAGYLEFHIESVLTGIEPADAPCRLRITFGEILNDVAESFDNYK
jgi:alpha-L-rhamnosidase